MKNYDLIVIGTGSGLNYVDSFIEREPEARIAVIDKDEPGGICLTRGCIPSKLLLYPAELIREIERGVKFGIDVKIRSVDFKFVMERMRKIIQEDINAIHNGLSKDPNIDYYHETAEFVSPYTLKTGNEVITSKMIFLCTGSKPTIPPIKGLDGTGYLTSDTMLEITELPGSIAIVGGGYIAAEYGLFFSAMGSDVTVIGRNPVFIPSEEPEISALAEKHVSGYMKIMTGHEVVEVSGNERKKVIAKDRSSGEEVEVVVDEILIASGRGPNTDILHPEKGNIKTDSKGWIIVDEYLETSQPGIYAFGDATGKHLLKHVANYESGVVFNNAIMKNKVKVDYHAVPHAVFSYPEIASVGMKEKQAIDRYGEDNILIGFQMYEETAKGHAMDVRDYFAKVISEKDTRKILGAHIIGPHASILIHQIIPAMYAPGQSLDAIIYSMDIHPALSEVVTRACRSLMPPAQYHHLLGHKGLED